MKGTLAVFNPSGKTLKNLQVSKNLYDKSIYMNKKPVYVCVAQ